MKRARRDESNFNKWQRKKVIFLAERKPRCREVRAIWERPDACRAGVKEPWA